MKDVKREILILVQYLGLLLLAFAIAFVAGLMWLSGGGSSGGELAEAININEAWRNVAPLFWIIFLTFSALGVIRILMIFLAHRFGEKSFE